MKIHPIAECYPKLSESEFQTLKTHIKKNGLQNPIVLFEEQILDGAHRYRACYELRIEPAYIRPDIKDPFEYVIGQNERRRQLTLGQIANVGERMATLKRGQPRKLEQSNPSNEGLMSESAAVQQVAKRLGISDTSIERVRYAKEKGIQEISKAIEAGTIKPGTAARIAHLSKQRQVSALKDALSGKKLRIIRKDKAREITTPQQKEIQKMIHESKFPPMTERLKRTWHMFCASEFPLYTTREEQLTVFQYLIACSTKAIELIDEITKPEQLYDLAS